MLVNTVVLSASSVTTEPLPYSIYRIDSWSNVPSSLSLSEYLSYFTKKNLFNDVLRDNFDQSLLDATPATAPSEFTAFPPESFDNTPSLIRNSGLQGEFLPNSFFTDMTLSELVFMSLAFVFTLMSLYFVLVQTCSHTATVRSWHNVAWTLSSLSLLGTALQLVRSADMHGTRYFSFLVASQLTDNTTVVLTLAASYLLLRFLRAAIIAVERLGVYAPKLTAKFRRLRVFLFVLAGIVVVTVNVTDAMLHVCDQFQIKAIVFWVFCAYFLCVFLSMQVAVGSLATALTRCITVITSPSSAALSAPTPQPRASVSLNREHRTPLLAARSQLPHEPSCDVAAPRAAHKDLYKLLVLLLAGGDVDDDGHVYSGADGCAGDPGSAPSTAPPSPSSRSRALTMDQAFSSPRTYSAQHSPSRPAPIPPPSPCAPHPPAYASSLSSSRAWPAPLSGAPASAAELDHIFDEALESISVRSLSVRADRALALHGAPAASAPEPDMFQVSPMQMSASPGLALAAPPLLDTSLAPPAHASPARASSLAAALEKHTMERRASEQFSQVSPQPSTPAAAQTLVAAPTASTPLASPPMALTLSSSVHPGVAVLSADAHQLQPLPTPSPQPVSRPAPRPAPPPYNAPARTAVAPEKLPSALRTLHSILVRTLRKLRMLNICASLLFLLAAGALAFHGARNIGVKDPVAPTGTWWADDLLSFVQFVAFAMILSVVSHVRSVATEHQAGMSGRQLSRIFL